MTVDERRAQLLAAGTHAGDVEEMIDSESIDGVWCDGSIVTDERGRRCVSRAQIDRVQRARAALPAAVAPSRKLPIAIVAAAVLVVGFVMLERE